MPGADEQRAIDELVRLMHGVVVLDERPALVVDDAQLQIFPDVAYRRRLSEPRTRGRCEPPAGWTPMSAQ